MSAPRPARRYFSFLAQNLDNASPDVMSVQGRLLVATRLRDPDRVRLSRAVSTMTRDGKRIEVDGTTARGFVLDDQILIESPSPERDVAGRLSPIVCIGRRGQPADDFWCAALIDELEEFSERAARTMSVRQQSDIHRLFDRMTTSRTGVIETLTRAPHGAINWLRGGRDQPPVEPLAEQRVVATLPEEPTRRQIIVVLDETDVRLLANRSADTDLFRTPGVCVWSPRRPADGVERSTYLQQVVDRLEQRGPLPSRTVLVRDLYGLHDYLEVDDADLGLMESKLVLFTELCGLLGARSVETLAATSIGVDESHDVSVAATSPALLTGARLTADASRQRRREERRERIVSRRATWADRTLDEPAARRLLSERRVEWDRDCQWVIDLCTTRAGRLANYEYELSTAEAVERITRLAGGVSVADTGVHTELLRLQRRSTSWHVTVRVSF